MADEIRSVSSTYCKETPAGRPPDRTPQPRGDDDRAHGVERVVHKPSVKGSQPTISCWGDDLRQAVDDLGDVGDGVRAARQVITRERDSDRVSGNRAIVSCQQSAGQPATNEFTCLQLSEPDSVGARATPIKKIKWLRVRLQATSVAQRYDRARAMP